MDLNGPQREDHPQGRPRIHLSPYPGITRLSVNRPAPAYLSEALVSDGLAPTHRPHPHPRIQHSLNRQRDRPEVSVGDLSYP